MMRLFILVTVLFTLPAHANQALEPHDVLASSLKHFPDILKAAQELAASDARIRNAEGAFDASIEQSLSSRPNGFYSGKQADTRLVKPLPFMNTKLYGGYRVSDGSFPIYDDKLITNSGGEYLFGFQMSLLRDRMIDGRRLKLYNNQISRDSADIDMLLTKVAIQHDALYHYWHWVAAGHVKKVYASLLTIAEERQSGLKERVRRGDTAEIYLTENQQYLLKRQAQLNDAQRELIVRANQLSLYLRNQGGAPLVAKPEEVPPAFPQTLTPYDRDNLLTALEKRPELQRIHQQIAIQNNEVNIGENMQLPKADVSMEMSDDSGSGSLSRAPYETRVMLNVSIPLQQRLGEGRASEAKAKIRKLEYDKQFMLEKLMVELENALTELENSRKYVELTKQEITMAKTMQVAERKRFDNGESDFFVLNMREERMAEAEVKHIEANQKFQVALAHLYALTLDYRNLMIEV
jgi:outer membrane protein TolC